MSYTATFNLLFLVTNYINHFVLLPYILMYEGSNIIGRNVSLCSVDEMRMSEYSQSLLVRFIGLLVQLEKRFVIFYNRLAHAQYKSIRKTPVFCIIVETTKIANCFDRYHIPYFGINLIVFNISRYIICFCINSCSHLGNYVHLLA